MGPTKRNMAFAGIFLLCMSFATYGNSLKGEFMMDDYSLILRHDHSLTFKNILGAFRPNADNVGYRPVSETFRIFLRHYYRDSPFWYRLTNVILFWANCFLIYLLGCLLFRRPELSFVVSLLFCVHPINSTPVAYITGQEILLFGLFSWVSIIFFIRYVCDPRKPVFMVISVATFVFGFLTQEIVLMLSIYYFLIGLFLLSDFKKAIKFSCPFLFVTLSYVIFRMLWVMRTRDILHLAFSSANALHMNFLSYITDVSRLIFWYIGKLISPDNIVLMHSPALSLNQSLWLESLLVVVFLILWTGYALFKRNISLFALGWFVLGFIPVGLLCFIYPAAGLIIEPHWLFISSVGFYMFIAQVYESVKNNSKSIIARGLLSIILMIGCFKTQEYNFFWQEEKRYCAYWLSLEPRHHLPNFWLAYWYFNRLDFEPARFYFKRALVGGAMDWDVYINLGLIEQYQGHRAKAIEYFQRALVFNPMSAAANNNLGHLCHKEGNFQEAENYFKRAIILDEKLLTPRINLADVYVEQHRRDEAIQAYRGILELDPRNTKGKQALDMLSQGRWPQEQEK